MLPDDETLHRIALFIGVMMGADAANRVVAQIAQQLGDQVAKRLPRQALTKYGFYNVCKQIGKWIGVQVTKNSFGRAISRIVPVISGIVASSVSAVMMQHMATRLKGHLRGLRYAKP